MNSTSTRLRATSIPLLVLAFVLSTVSLVIFNAPPARADGHDCGLICTGGTVGGGGGPATPNDPDPGLPGDPGNDGGGGGNGGYFPAYEWSDGGQGFFPSRPPAQIGGRGGSYTDSSGVWNYGGQCDGNFSWSANGRTYSEPYAGWRWYVYGTYMPPFIGQPGDPSIDMDTLLHAFAGGYSCIEPPKYYEYNITCAMYADANLFGPDRNPEVASRTTGYPRQSSAWSSDQGNVSKCQRSWPFNFGDTPTDWGRYTLTATGYAKTCTRRVYYSVDPRTGSVPPSELIGCGPTYEAVTAQAFLELYCAPPYADQVFSDNWTYTSADCGDGDPTTGPPDEWTCGPQINRNPTFVGRRTFPAPVMDDGEKRRASWEQPEPTGNIRNVRDKETRLLFTGGSPFRPGEPNNGDTQPFLVDPKNNASWTQGWEVLSPNNNRSAWNLAFFAAGNAGDPWRARPIWKFDADFRFMVPNITFNPMTGSLTWTLSPRWVEKHFVCRGQEVQVDVHRARNSSN